MNERGIETNQQLGEAVGLSHVAIGNFLRGQLPKSEHLLSLARFFDVPMEQLLGAEVAAERGRARKAVAARIAEDVARVESGEQSLLVFNIAGIRAAAERCRATAADLLATADDLDRQAKDIVAASPKSPSQSQTQSQADS